MLKGSPSATIEISDPCHQMHFLLVVGSSHVGDGSGPEGIPPFPNA